MPGSKKTPNFELPYYGPLDTFSALVTYNGLAQQLDNILKTLQTKGEQNGTLIAEVQDALDAVHASVDANTTLIEQINQNANAWGLIYKPHIFNLTPASGIASASLLLLSNTSTRIVITQITCIINISGATTTEFGNYKYIDVFSSPDIFPMLPSGCINYSSAIQIGRAIGYWRLISSENREVAEFPVFAYRNENVTRFFTKVAKTNFANLGYVSAFSIPTFINIPNSSN